MSASRAIRPPPPQVPSGTSCAKDEDAQVCARLRVEHRLTETGLELFPVVVALREWGDRWMADPSARRRSPAPVRRRPD